MKLEGPEAHSRSLRIQSGMELVTYMSEKVKGSFSDKRTIRIKDGIFKVFVS